MIYKWWLFHVELLVYPRVTWQHVQPCYREGTPYIAKLVDVNGGLYPWIMGVLANL